MIKFDKNVKDNFSLLPDTEARFQELREKYEKTFRSDDDFQSLLSGCADVMEEAYAVGLYPDSGFLVSWLFWLSNEFERREIQDASEMLRLGRVLLLCQTKEDMANSINTYAFSALIPAKEFKEAESWLRKGVNLEVRVQSINCLSNLGVMHYQQERYDEALLEFLLVFATNSNWNRAEAIFYLAHILADSKCRENSVSQGLLLKVMGASDSHYSKKASNCFAGRCEASKKTFSRAASLRLLDKDFSEQPSDFVFSKEDELGVFLSSVAEGLAVSGAIQPETDWRHKPLSHWMEQIENHGINASGLIEYLSEKLVGEIEALVMLYAAGLTAEPEESAVIGLLNCRYGVGWIAPHTTENHSFNSIALSGGFNFDNHRLFASWTMEHESRYRGENGVLTGLQASKKNYISNAARREPYFGESIMFTGSGVQGIDFGSRLDKEGDDSYPIHSSDNETLILLELISREFLFQLNQCVLGEKELSTVSPEAICRRALAKVERFHSPLEFDAESLMTRTNEYAKERTETAWALDGQEGNVRAYVSVLDLFGAIAISIAQGNFDWALLQTGKFGVRDFQAGDTSDENVYQQLFPHLQLIWPLCWTLGARFLIWDPDETVPFKMNWSASKLESSKDSETISLLLKGGQELDGYLPKIISGNEQQGDHAILNSMTDEELSVVARSNNLSVASIELIYSMAGPAALASLMLNKAVSDGTFEGNRWEAITNRVDIAWLIAKELSEGSQEIDQGSLDELTKAFGRSTNYRATSKFASSKQLSDSHLRELALVGNDLIADAVLNNPNASDETKALAKIGI